VRWWIGSAAAAYFLFFYRLTGTGLVGPDEPRYAWIGRAMAQSGDWITPRLWGEPWFEKPALLYWMEAAAFRAGLGDDWAPRLPIAALSVAFLLFFYRRMREEFGAPAAGYASAVLATSAGWVGYSHAAVADLPLAATFGAAMLSLLGWTERRDGRAVTTFAVFLGLAALAKGLVAPALAALTLACWALRAGAAPLGDFFRPLPALAFIAVAAPWYLLCWLRNGSGFLEEFFWKQHFSRYALGALEHNQPVWFFLPVLAGALLPWTPLVALAGGLRWRDRRVWLLLSWAAATLAFFSLSRDKLPGYILPALPALAALAGVALAGATSARPALAACAATLALMPAAAAVLPGALDRGLGSVLGEMRFPPLALAAVAVVSAGVWLAERAGRRSAAVAAVAAAAVVSYAVIKHITFPAIEGRAGARVLWQKARPHGDMICLGEIRRHLAYGLTYYAGRSLPRCDDEPKPYRIQNGEIVFDLAE